MRKSISSKEIAERFGFVHRDVTRSIRKILKEDYNASSFFTKTEYVSSQNKPLPSFDMNFSGFSYLTDTRSYSRGENAVVKAEIMREFGESCVVVSSVRTRREDCFFDMLKRATIGVDIVRQYAIAGYRVDFYLPEFGLFVEYDEEQHFSKQHRDADDNRWAAIRGYIKDRFDDEIRLIRVDAGSEFEGIGAIIGFMALSTQNGIGATGIYDRYIAMRDKRK